MGSFCSILTTNSLNESSQRDKHADMLSVEIRAKLRRQSHDVTFADPKVRQAAKGVILQLSKNKLYRVIQLIKIYILSQVWSKSDKNCGS